VCHLPAASQGVQGTCRAEPGAAAHERAGRCWGAVHRCCVSTQRLVVLIFIGYLVVLFSVFGGFVLVGGHMGALNQPVEILIIGAAAVGAFLASNSGKSAKATLNVLPKLLRRSQYDKDMYMELMALLYVLLTKARREGMMA